MVDKREGMSIAVALMGTLLTLTIFLSLSQQTNYDNSSWIDIVVAIFFVFFFWYSSCYFLINLYKSSDYKKESNYHEIVVAIILAISVVGFTIFPTVFFSEVLVGFSQSEKVSVYTPAGNESQLNQPRPNYVYFDFTEDSEYEEKKPNESIILKKNLGEIRVHSGAENIKIKVFTESEPGDISYNRSELNEYISPPDDTYESNGFLVAEKESVPSGYEMILNAYRKDRTLEPNSNGRYCWVMLNLNIQIRYTVDTALGDTVVVQNNANIWAVRTERYGAEGLSIQICSDRDAFEV